MVASEVLVDSVPVTFRLDIFANVVVLVYDVVELVRMSFASADAHVRVDDVVMGPWLDHVARAPPRPVMVLPRKRGPALLKVPMLQRV
jgi:hypothetical protein